MSAAPHAPPLERSPAGDRNPWLVAVVISMATFMEVLDTSVANVSLPHIAGNLSASQDESTWILTSYLVSNAIVLPISGWLATVIGRKRFYLSCVALFGLSSLLCGLAPSLGALVCFRILQGLGGGGLAPTEQSMLADMFPPQKRGQAFALYGIAVVVAPTLGPTLGGWITDNFSWRWIFLVNVPVTLLSLFLAGRLLVDPPAVKRDRAQALRGGLRIDYFGFALVALALGCLQVVLDKGEEDDWFASPFILSFSIVSALSLVFLIFWELSQEHPIVDLSLMKNRNFSASMLVMFVTGFILIATTQIIPRFLQTILGYPATDAGLALTAGGCATLAVMPLVGRLSQKVPAKYLIVAGLVIECAACFHLATLNTHIDFRHIALARMAQAIGLPFLFVPISAVAYAGLPPGKNDDASALINTMRNLGGSFGISFATTLLAERGQFHHSRLSESVNVFAPAFQNHLLGPLAALNLRVTRQAAMLGYIDIFWLLGWLAALAVPVTFILRRPPPGGAAAMH